VKHDGPGSRNLHTYIIYIPKASTNKPTIPWITTEAVKVLSEAPNKIRLAEGIITMRIDIRLKTMAMTMRYPCVINFLCFTIMTLTTINNKIKN
jgi:hypothetical protein